MEKLSQKKEVISIAFEGMHRVGKGAHIELLKSRLAESGILAIDIRGDGLRTGKGETAGDPYSEWWLKFNQELQELRKKQDDKDVTEWDKTAYRLARELIVWRDRLLSRQVKESESLFGVLIMDRSLLSRAAFIKHHLQPSPEKNFSSEDLYPKHVQHRKKITVDMILPDLIIELVAPKEVLMARLNSNDPKYKIRKQNIENMYDAYINAKSHLSKEIRERIATIDSSRDQETVFTEIENIIKQRFPDLFVLSKLKSK